MTVAELIKELRKCPPRGVVFLQDADRAGGTMVSEVEIEHHFDAVMVHLR